jgi:hypothetical protein
MAVAQNVTATINFNFNTQQTITTGNINAAGSVFNGLVTFAKQYVNAQGVNYGVDQLFAQQLTLASTTGTYHFETATQKDPWGNTLAMLRIRDLIIQNTNTTLGQDLEYYASASNGIAWLPTVSAPLIVRAGGLDWKSDPLGFGAAVGNYITATTDGLTVNSLSATVIFNLVVIGNSQA